MKKGLIKAWDIGRQRKYILEEIGHSRVTAHDPPMGGSPRLHIDSEGYGGRDS